MHQPYYKNPYTGKMELPWVRLHALKDYYGMVRLLKDLPNTKVTFNLVPSLLIQLQDYLNGHRDLFQEIFKKDADSLEPGELRFLVRHFFSANHDHLIKPYPRYHHLFHKRQEHQDSKEGKEWRKIFSTAEIRDIQVWFNLCYFDEEYKEKDERIKGLIEKGENFSEEDKILIEEAELELMGKIIPEYKKFADTGLVEITTTPFYHPIMPLLLDPQQGRVANPGLPRYSLNFNWKEDAVAQMEAALTYMEKTFGKRPEGIWPSEGSLSTEVLGILENLGIKWTATDELNLSKSLSIPIDRDENFTVKNPKVLYKPYVLKDGQMKIFFRDNHLSDLIGFQYQKMPFQRAAEDLVQRIKAAGVFAEKGKRTNREMVVPIILDGENAWEYYPNSGREFLREFFRLVEQDEILETVTFSECIEPDSGVEPEVIEEFSSGSWINGNFDIWIGDHEDRKAWKLIESARNAYKRRESGLPEDKKKEIMEYIYIAEGSDWFWWFGKENYTPDLDIFDHLLRRNLQKVYDLLSISPPHRLFNPVSTILKKTEIEVVSPKAYIAPEIDGKEGHYFKWLNAGSVEVAAIGGAMTFSNSLVNALFYGFDKQNLYLRADTPRDAEQLFDEGYTLNIVIIKDKKETLLNREILEENGEFAAGTIIECKVPLDFISIEEGDAFYLYLEWKRGGQHVQTIPSHDYFRLTVPTAHDYAHFWMV
jgi:alpha-amylase/alpha-mannosidase (GH57 family)